MSFCISHEENQRQKAKGWSDESLWLIVTLRGPQMGGQIRRGWIWRFFGRPIFSPEVPKSLFSQGFGTSGLKIGAPQKRQNSATTDLNPPFAVLWHITRGPKTAPLLNRAFVPPKRGGFRRKRRKWRICTLTSKTRSLLLRPGETTKMTTMAGVTRAKAWITKCTVFLFPD